MLQPLPIDAHLPAALADLARAGSLVVRAPTGSGKTTRLPQAVLDQLGNRTGQVLLLEPRRVAARAAARRIAEERGGTLGDEVGYRVRFDQCVSARTRLVVMTEGVLLRRLQDDPFLEEVAAVLFDEFHERSLASDLALAMCRRVRESVRPDLRLVVMSATLDPAPLVAWLGGAATLESSGRSYPVDVRYLTPIEVGELMGADRRVTPFPKTAAATAQLVAWGVPRIWQETAGDVLCFLPGVGEIRRTAEALAGFAASQNAELVELYGDLPPEKQDAALKPGPRRRIILATNVAETSLTIPGVTAVVDTGLARVLSRDASTGLDRLELSRISKASAEQRAGRAGRTQAGVCLRLWMERDHLGLPEREEPEIRRVDLAGSVLQLMAWGEPDPAAFPWFERPRESSLGEAVLLLERLGAVEGDRVTPLGQALAGCPAHPRIARLLAAGVALGCGERAALAGAILSERDPFPRDPILRAGGPRGGQATTARHTSQSDLVDRVVVLETALRTGRYETELGTLQRGAAKQVRAAARQLGESVRDLRRLIRPEGTSSSGDEETALRRAVLVAFPDRVARRRESGSARAILVGGRGVRLAPQSAVTEAELFVAVDLAAGEAEGDVRLASAIEAGWLPEGSLTTGEELRFEATRERVEAVRSTRYLDLALAEVRINPTDGEAVAECLHRAACAAWDRVVPKATDVEQFLARVACLREWLPEAGLPCLDTTRLQEIARDVCYGRRSFAELREGPWLETIRASLTPADLQLLDREAPERLLVPSGSRIALVYEPGRPPVLAARIQELFGLKETPRVARGRIAVLMHLLAPNMRPQQVTQDLQSFWSTTYAEVRKELKRRYPKHAWPEDPWTAQAQARPGKRPSG